MGSTCLTAPRIHLIMANSWSRQWGQPHLHEANYAVYEAEAVEIWRELACSRSGVSLGYYPGNPIIYWFTGMRPVSRYIVMWPWIAEVALADVISSLDEELAVACVADTAVWDKYSTREYAHSLLTWLDRNYVRLKNTGMYRLIWRQSALGE
jgi:hypothetical protein